MSTLLSCPCCPHSTKLSSYTFISAFSVLFILVKFFHTLYHTFLMKILRFLKSPTVSYKNLYWKGGVLPVIAMRQVKTEHICTMG